MNINSTFSLTKFLSSSLTWVFFDKFFRLVLILVSEILLARYLGPEHFGIYSYVIAIYALFLVISSFGIDNNLVKDLVHDPDQHDVLVTSATLIKLLGGVFAFFIASVWAFYFSHDQFLLIALISIGYLFHWTKVFELYFQSQNNFRFIALSAIFTGLCFFIIKLILIFQNYSLVSFLIVYILELICSGLMIFMICARHQNISIRLDLSIVKRHIQISWPLVLSGIAVTIYLKIDQVMLQHYAGNSALGIYAAAIKLSEGWYFIGGLITAVMAPKIYHLQQTSQIDYDKFLEKIIAYLTLLALGIVIFTSLMSEILLNFLYGSAYQGASIILKVHIWALFFAYLGCVQGIYWIAEGMQKIFLYQNLCSALLNICLNLILIPQYHGVGAAWATFIAYGLPVLMVPYFVPRARHLHQIHLGALYRALSILGIKRKHNSNHSD